jgi:hypothetical protein
MEEPVVRVWWAAGACFVLACSGIDTGRLPEEGSPERGPGKELIPAEWTIAEDTAVTGEITTLSLQLPSARDIGELLDDEPPRLILRCLDGRIAAFIDTESSIRAAASTPASDTELVQVQLDSAPACE